MYSILFILIVILIIYVIIRHCYESSFEHMKGQKFYTINIFDASPGYTQPYLEIKQNDVVVWGNTGKMIHTVTSDKYEFDSGYLNPGEVFALKFPEKGIYQYHDIMFNKKTKGVIKVI